VSPINPNVNPMRVLIASILLLGLSGCSFLTFGLLGDDGPKPHKHKGPSIGQVVRELPTLELPEAPTYKPTRQEVMAAYNRVYGMLPNAQENHAVGKRLADLHMDRGQDLDIEGQAAPYDPAVALYERLLNENPDAEKRDEILYQLSRASDLTIQSERTLDYLNRLIDEHPDSAYVAEARFRRAEMRFSAEQYRDAAEDYSFVVNLGEQTPYYRNASYMLGWSEFKRSRFDEGLHQFFNVADNLIGHSVAAGENLDIDQLAAIDRELLNDTFRVVTLALAYLDGAQTLADEMRKRGRPAWQYFAYQRLADDYFEKERFLDNVATWQTFVEHNSLDARAPAAHKGMIKTLMDAGFPSDVIPKKQEYIVRYGVYSEFWSHHDAQIRETYLPTLHLYLSEMAKLAHADAQEFDGLDKKALAKLKLADPASHRRGLYLSAAKWYEEMIATFPADPRTAEFLFLLGESYTEAQEPARAVAAYQRVIRDFPEFDRASEAGYAAILGLSQLVTSASPEEMELWQRLKIDAQIEFALIFPGDPRAPAVQTDAADTLFALGHSKEAMDLAENLLAEWPDVDNELRKTALLIIGHGQFELDQFAPAEVAYHELLAGELTTAERARVQERLLAAVYKQGEAAEQTQDSEQAVYHFMRIAQIDPSAALAAQGHFDAIAVVESTGAIAEAAQLLSQFRDVYPGHELGRDIDVRLAAMYEQSGDVLAAATEYVRLSKSAGDKEVARQSLYRAAEIYFEQNDIPLAIEHFRDYAHTYKQPATLRMEAMHHMDLLYAKTGEEDKRRFWLQKKIDLHRDMGRDADARATFLAASAQYTFAADQRAAFRSVRLSHPLKRSLKKKQSALKRSLKAYEKVASYEVAEFTAASTFEIADLYSALSQSIMASDRPKNLSALELEQYEILLEEQAFPFEDQAIDLHQINMRRAWAGTYDDWVKKSFEELARLMPGRFNKPEREVTYAQAIH